MNERDDEEPTGPQAEGLRERKKRLMRQLISDTATGMFLERGFDDVKVTEIAEACGVSEKTVYNYFSTKEALLLDREEDIATAIRAAFGPGAPARSPIEAALEILAQDVESLRVAWRSGGEKSDGLRMFRRFTDLVDSTPSLRAAQRDMMDRLVRVAAEAMAERAGVSPDDPEPQIAADAILGLWRIQYQAMRRYADDEHTPDEVIDLAAAEVRRAARLIESGLWAFGVMVQGGGSREQLTAAAEAAHRAGKQVATALRQARTIWREIQQEAQAGGHEPRGAHGQQEEWKRVQRDQKEQWKQIVKEQHEQIQQARRDLQQKQRQLRRDMQQSARAARDPRRKH
ncbi:MAG TPA: TetR/AcrR family transcriptional regulator [Mycobacteriales bacterium]|jgi:AcrR family transcriptional regulator